MLCRTAVDMWHCLLMSNLPLKSLVLVDNYSKTVVSNLKCAHSKVKEIISALSFEILTFRNLIWSEGGVGTQSELIFKFSVPKSWTILKVKKYIFHCIKWSNFYIHLPFENTWSVPHCLTAAPRNMPSRNLTWCL